MVIASLLVCAIGMLETCVHVAKHTHPHMWTRTLSHNQFFFVRHCTGDLYRRSHNFSISRLGDGLHHILRLLVPQMLYGRAFVRLVSSVSWPPPSCLPHHFVLMRLVLATVPLCIGNCCMKALAHASANHAATFGGSASPGPE